MNLKAVLICALALVVGACSEGVDDPASVSDVRACQSISGGMTSVAATGDGCGTCVVFEAEQAIDGDFDTAAQLIVPVVTSGFAGLRVNAQDGVVFPRGSTASAIASFERNANVAVSSQLSLQTYLNGFLQESVSFSNDSIAVNGISGSSKRQWSLKTSEPYDAVAFGVTGLTENYQFQYFEFCTE